MDSFNSFSLTEVCGWSFLRSFAVTLACLPLCFLHCRALKTSTGRKRQLAWVLLLAPFFTPELIIGYVYSETWLSLIRHRALNELAYTLLLIFKFAPIGTVALYFSPPHPVSAEARHCWRMSFRATDGALRRFLTMAGMRLRGSVQTVFPTFALVFLLAFQEFEIASRMGTISWTVWLLDAQAAGLQLSQSLRHALLPLACEAIILLPLLLFVLIWRQRPAASHEPINQLPPFAQFAHWSMLSIAFVAICCVPFAIIGLGTFSGFSALAGNRVLLLEFLREIATGVFFGALAAFIAYGIAARILKGGASKRFDAMRWSAVCMLCLWGLFGSLLLSLSLLWVFQSPLLRIVYDTPIPMTIGLALYLLPRALLLLLLHIALQRSQGLHLATMLKQSTVREQRLQSAELTWQLHGRGRFWIVVLLCYWGYLDLTIAATLSPTGMVSAPVRLYNLMHYGRSEILTTMTCGMVAVPGCLLLVLLAFRRPLFRWLVP